MPRYLGKHYFWVCLWACFRKILALESVDWVKQVAPPRPHVGSRHLPTCLNKKAEKGEFYVRELKPDVDLLLPSDWDLHRWHFWFSGIWTQVGTNHRLSGAQMPCRWQIAGLVGLCHYVSQLCMLITSYFTKYMKPLNLNVHRWYI